MLFGARTDSWPHKRIPCFKMTINKICTESLNSYSISLQNMDLVNCFLRFAAQNPRFREWCQYMNTCKHAHKFGPKVNMHPHSSPYCNTHAINVHLSGLKPPVDAFMINWCANMFSLDQVHQAGLCGSPPQTYYSGTHMYKNEAFTQWQVAQQVNDLFLFVRYTVILCHFFLHTLPRRYLIYGSSRD